MREASGSCARGTNESMGSHTVDSVVVDDMEKRLRAAMLDRGGPARPTDELAITLGFSSANRMPGETSALWRRIEGDEALTALDWWRVLRAAELVFASDVVGSGLDWSTTTGISDADGIAVLRRTQRMLRRWRSRAQFQVENDGQVNMVDANRAADTR